MTITSLTLGINDGWLATAEGAAGLASVPQTCAFELLAG